MRITGGSVRLWDWVAEHDIRLDIRMELELDPALGEPVWHCEILGFPNTDAARPAVFILESAHGPESLIEASDSDPGTAYRQAVHHLRGKTVAVIIRERDDRIVVPLDLTI